MMEVRGAFGEFGTLDNMRHFARTWQDYGSAGRTNGVIRQVAG
jgi:hypothetical protein